MEALHKRCRIGRSYNSAQNGVTVGIGVARGCSGCTCTPRADKKSLGIIYRENL